MKKQLIGLVCIFCMVFSFPVLADNPPRLNVDFKGGTATELAETVGKLGLNIVLQPGTENIYFPRLKLRNVLAEDLFKALSRIGWSADIPYEWQDTAGSAAHSVFTLTKLTAKDAQREIVRPQPLAMPIAIGRLLKSDVNPEGYTIEEITTAIMRTIEAGYAATGSGLATNPTFQYHKETEILIISGEEDHVVGLAMETIGALDDSLGIKRMKTKEREMKNKK